MQKKILLVATFVNPDYLEKFLLKLQENFNINKHNVFMFEMETGGLLLTYRIHLDLGERINLRKELPKTVQVHKKGTTFFTINALNRLIERDFGIDGGNVNYQSYDVDWDKYQDNIILLKNNELDILTLTKKIIE